MFRNQWRLTLTGPDGEKPVPKSWLDQFFMRDFTGYSAFDDTLVVAEGRMEAGMAVEPGEIREQFEKWLRGRKMISAETRLSVTRC